MRSLAFTAERFEIIYEGLLNSQRGFDAPSETRIVGKILEKLEDEATQELVGGVTTYRLKNGKGAVVNLSDEEYKLLVSAVKAVKWTARIATKATDAIEWLEGVESS